jgi:peptidoglycan/LPS O-acetylase OafA/YrhL
MKQSTPPYFETVDILRVFAALSVIFYYFIEHFNWKALPATGQLLWFKAGYRAIATATKASAD